MTEIKNLNQALVVLLQFVPPAKDPRDAKQSLTNMRGLMKHLGNPQESYRVVHIAGTSGKTSTAYYVAALLKAAGKKVGLTVSPHVDSVNERVQVGLVPLAEAEFCSELTIFLQLITDWPHQPSYFEVLIAFAYWEFARQKVDYAVIEVGMGGMLDATNVISREDKLCIITDIGLDHTEYLGNTLGEIASQKAGIIQPKNLVYMYEQSTEVMEQIHARCRAQKESKLITIQPERVGDTSLPLFQQRNWQLAASAVQALGVALPSGAIRAEVQHTVVPARMEIFTIKDKIVIVDGSHNTQKLTALCTSIRDKYPTQKIASLISFGAGDDQRVVGGMEVIATTVASCMVTSFAAGQDVPKHSVPITELAKIARDKGIADVSTEQDPVVAFEKLRSRPEPIILVTGSFYLLNHIRPLIKQLV
jgi:dihydrofolate synthase / folylpolyglutamate synthase